MEYAGGDESRADVPGHTNISSASVLRRVLIIEDEPSAGIIIAKLAEKTGFAATIAMSVAEAIRLLCMERYDCITLDLKLGKNSGVELVRTLADKAAGTPIIIVSGSPPWMRSTAESIGRVARLNIVESLTKPIDCAKLQITFMAVKEKLAARTEA